MAMQRQGFYPQPNQDPFRSSSSNQGAFDVQQAYMERILSGNGSGGNGSAGGQGKFGRRGEQRERQDIVRKVMGKRTPTQEQVGCWQAAGMVMVGIGWDGIG